MLNAPSHQVDQIGDRVIVRSLELFVGFDKSIDDPDDKRVKKYDRKAVEAVLARTQQYIERKQSPKLILGHNQTDTDNATVRQCIGDITNLRLIEIGDAAGIAGDIEMSQSDFNIYLKSNSYPRRSAEIWPDGFMSEVALLGSETPARPLPDTKFTRSCCTVHQSEQFSRDYAALFAEPTESMHGPGPMNVHIPSTGKKRKHDMPDPDDKTKLAELEKENEKLKAKLAKYMHEDDDDKDKKDHDDEDLKSTNSRIHALETEVEQHRRSAIKKGNELANLSSKFVRSTMSAKLDLMAQQGFDIGDSEEDCAELLNRICAASDPDAELEFFAKRMRQHPINTVILQQGADSFGSAKSLEDQAAASDRAVERSTKENKPELYHKYLAEELAA